MSCHSHNELEEEEEGGDVVGLPEALDNQGHFLGQLGLVECQLEGQAAGGKDLGIRCLPISSPKRAIPKRTRQGSLSFAKCTAVPISSPMGRVLLKHHNPFTASSMLAERTERHCSKPFMVKVAPCPKPSSTRGRRSRSPRNGQWVHNYSFSVSERKQRYAVLNTGLDRRSRHLLARCKTLKIVLRKLTELEIARHARPSGSVTDDNQLASSVNYVTKREIPVIDLCISSDEEVAAERCRVPESSVFVPSVLLHQLTCTPRPDRPYRLDNNLHIKLDPMCIQKRVKSTSGGPSENRVLGIPFLGRKPTPHKPFRHREPDSKGKLKELNKIKKSNCVPPKVNWPIKCGETRL